MTCMYETSSVTLDSVTTTATMDFTSVGSLQTEGAKATHTLVIGGTFATDNIVAIQVDDGVNTRYLGHWDAPGRVTFHGRIESITATVLDVSDLLSGIDPSTSIVVRAEHSDDSVPCIRNARLIRTIRTAEANSVITLDVDPAVPSDVNILPGGADRANSTHVFQLVGVIGGAVSLTITAYDRAGVDTELGVVPTADLPWGYPGAGTYVGDLDRVTITVPVGFTTTGLQFIYLGTIEEV